MISWRPWREPRSAANWRCWMICLKLGPPVMSLLSWPDGFKHENTRVMMALAQAADEEPRVRKLFQELADGIFGRMESFCPTSAAEPTDESRRLLHALSVGLAVVDLAVARPGGEGRASDVFGTALTLLQTASRKKSSLSKKKETLQILMNAKSRAPCTARGCRSCWSDDGCGTGRYQVPLRIIDESPARTDKSKAVTLWSRTLELLERAGSADDFISIGLKLHASNFISDGDTWPGSISTAFTRPMPSRLRFRSPRRNASWKSGFWHSASRWNASWSCKFYRNRRLVGLRPWASRRLRGEIWNRLVDWLRRSAFDHPQKSGAAISRRLHSLQFRIGRCSCCRTASLRK